MQEFLDSLGTSLGTFATTVGLKIVYALLVLLIGCKLVKVICNKIQKDAEKRNVEPTVGSFLRSCIKVILYATVVISAALILGIPAASFVAILGSAGLAVGLALQGSLSNLAGSIMLLLFRPYKVGDYVDVSGVSGTIQEINLLYTIVLTVDNKRITVPNGGAANSVIVDYSSMENRRVDLTFSTAYGTDAEFAKKTLLDLANSNPLVLKDPAAVCFMIEQADSSVNFVLRSWCKSGDYWTVYFALMQGGYDAFNKAGISIPFPQVDVHMK